MRERTPIILACLAATAGLVFASYSTFDFVQHLDRQVHEIHCSFVPGLAESSSRSEGCQLAMMSPYSSVLRKTVWGGVPISLPAMAVFVFLLFAAIEVRGRPAKEKVGAANVLLAASFIPVVASIVMGYIAATELGAACKLCIGIYVASAIVFVSAIWVRAAVKNNDHERAPTSASFYGLAAAQLLAFVAIPVIVYATLVPDFSRYIGTCGALKDSSDPQKIQVPLRADSNKTPAIEILDPLCPACRAFERRLEASGLHDELARKVVLFPLDSACNWMIETSLHPGACSISEAMLCADRNDAVSPADVLAWAFEHQEQVIAAAKTDAQVPAQMVTQAFPALKECVGSATVRARLNKSLRWAVTNQLPVMTPQLYIDGVKLCDEDTDLGLEWMLSRMIERHSAGTLQAHKAGEGQ